LRARVPCARQRGGAAPLVLCRIRAWWRVRGQGGIGIGVGQIRGFGVFFRECAFAGQHLQEAGDDPREYRLKLFSGGSWDGLEERDPVGQAIDAIKHQAMEMNIKIGLLLAAPLFCFKLYLLLIIL